MCEKKTCIYCVLCVIWPILRNLCETKITFSPKYRNMAVKVNLYLDERKIEKGEKAPVKLRLYISRTDIRHYHTNRYLTAEQFGESYLATKPKKAFKELKIALDAIVVKANNIVTKMDGLFVLAKF